MAYATSCGRRPCKPWPMKNTSVSPSPIIHLRPCPWNKIEHRLFSFISINWRATPLTSLETVIELISHTTTEEGLHVTAIKDSQAYPTGITLTDAELQALNIVRDPFDGEWNSIIKPQDTPSL
jgi:hypothetical protein